MAATEFTKILKSVITGKRVYKGKTKFKYVYEYTENGQPFFLASCKSLMIHQFYNTERAAAIGIDKRLIEIGREPIHILKRKTEILTEV